MEKEHMQRHLKDITVEKLKQWFHHKLQSDSVAIKTILNSGQPAAIFKILWLSWLTLHMIFPQFFEEIKADHNSFKVYVPLTTIL